MLGYKQRKEKRKGGSILDHQQIPPIDQEFSLSISNLRRRKNVDAF
jgi:hypothetical protein